MIFLLFLLLRTPREVEKVLAGGLEEDEYNENLMQGNLVKLWRLCTRVDSVKAFFRYRRHN